MIAAVRVSRTEFYLLSDHTPEVPSKHELPAAAMPPGISYRASRVPGHVESVFVNFFTEGKKHPAVTLWSGPYRDTGDVYYIVDMPESSMAPIAAVLGVEAIEPFAAMLKDDPKLRGIGNLKGLGKIRNTAGQVVGLYPPLALCGRSTLGLNGFDIEEAPEIIGLE